MLNSNFTEQKKRYWEFLETHRFPKNNHREGIKHFMECFMYTIGIDLDNIPQEYINKYMDTLDMFDELQLPADMPISIISPIIDDILLKGFGIHPSWNDNF